MEDLEAIAARLPSAYDSWLGAMRDGGNSFYSLFPPASHFHSLPMRKPGERRKSVGLAEWQVFLDEVGIERSVLYPSWALASARVTEMPYARAITRAYNEWVSETYAERDSRLNPMAILPLQDPDAAANELEYAVRELGLAGGCLPSHGLPRHLGSGAYDPVFAAADELDCPLAVHGGLHAGFGHDDMNVFAVAHGLGHPFGQLVSFGSIVMNGYFDRYPSLRMCFLEGGVAWLLLALERFPSSYETHLPLGDAVVLPVDDGDGLRKYIADLLVDGRIFIGCAGDEELLPQLTDQLGGNFLMYSSDFPHEVTVETCREALTTLTEDERLTPANREGILATNAATFYKFS